MFHVHLVFVLGADFKKILYMSHEPMPIYLHDGYTKF